MSVHQSAAESGESYFTVSRRRTLRRNLLRWYEVNARPLPWRLTSDPYRIWISEVMLQQTTVAAVIPYFERWFAVFPTVKALAEATEQDVLRQWEGLGYYSRAKNLKKAAEKIVSEFEGDFPSDPEQLQSLPGIGQYTAGAIASFAFDRAAPIVEANTERLYARLIAYEQSLQNAAGKRTLWTVAEELVPSREPGLFNQAVMELGSQVCRIVDPECSDCPIRTCCEAFAGGLVDKIPLAKTRPKVTERTEVAVVARSGDAILIRQRTESEQWAGLWDLPRIEAPRTATTTAFTTGRQPVLPGLFPEVEDAAATYFGQKATVTHTLADFRYGITRYRVRLLCFEVTVAQRTDPPDERVAWINEPDAYPLARPARRVVGDILFEERAS